MAGLALHGASPPLRRRIRADPARPAYSHVLDRPLAARRRQVHRADQLLADLERFGLLAGARLHRQIYARAHADPDGPGACAGAAHSREHPAQASHPRHRFPSGGDWPLEFESPVVLAARRTGRAPQQASRRPAPDTRADRLVRQRRSRFLGGRHLDHLEGRRLRHGAVRGGNPVDQSRHPRGGAHGRRRATGVASVSSSCR